MPPAVSNPAPQQPSAAAPVAAFPAQPYQQFPAAPVSFLLHPFHWRFQHFLLYMQQYPQGAAPNPAAVAAATVYYQGLGYDPTTAAYYAQYPYYNYGQAYQNPYGSFPPYG